ncbi:MAG: response regulator [Acidimicrobiales bacterium]
MSKIIVVEDNDLDAERIERQLRKFGAGDLLVRAKDGQEAIDLLAAQRMDPAYVPTCVVVVDLNMPRVNGFELIDHIRAIPALRHVPIYVCTTSDHMRDVHDADTRDVAGYIVKPITAEHVAELVERVREFRAVEAAAEGVCLPESVGAEGVTH